LVGSDQARVENWTLATMHEERPTYTGCLALCTMTENVRELNDVNVKVQIQKEVEIDE
jgi:hypothetical protein